MKPRPRLLLWGPLAAYAALLYALALQRDGTLLAGVDDAVLHAAGYGLLGALALRACHGGFEPLRLRRLLEAFVLTVGYGAFTELSQLVVAHREASFSDVAADAAGFLAAAAGWALLFPRRGSAAPVGGRGL